MTDWFSVYKSLTCWISDIYKTSICILLNQAHLFASLSGQIPLIFRAFPKVFRCKSLYIPAHFSRNRTFKIRFKPILLNCKVNKFTSSKFFKMVCFGIHKATFLQRRWCFFKTWRLFWKSWRRFLKEIIRFVFRLHHFKSFKYN